jgi:hypothetical protein
MIAAILEEEAALPAKHLIAHGVGQGAARVADLNPHVSVLNFHAAGPEAVRLNYRLGKVIADDETGGADRGDRKYRAEGWEFLLAGGGVFDHPDFSFTPGHEDGTALLPAGTPGGGGPELRRQLRVLKEFIEGFDFFAMAPDDAVVKSSRVEETGAGAAPATGATVRALFDAGKAYAIYVNGGSRAELVLDLPAGDYRAEWVNPKTGEVERSEGITHAGGDRSLVSPTYSEDIAWRVKRMSGTQAR